MSLQDLDQLAARFRKGVFIPAHPLALDANRRLDVRRQRALTRYYLDAGVDGLAVGVHTTQFAIREPQHALLLPALQLAAETVRSHSLPTNREPPLLIAGACGSTKQAICEAEHAHSLGYDAVLLSLAALGSASDDELIHHVRRVGEVMPIVGFYLQPVVGGRPLSFEFWQAFAEIPQVVAIKIAPFNRYQTLDVARAVSESTRWKEIALLTGNDDAIIHDLLSRYEFVVGGSVRHTLFSGGLLGHWACWTEASVKWFRQSLRARTETDGVALHELNRLAVQVTDMNAAIFDAKHRFRGCIAGIHEVLRRQGLFEGNWCLDPRETLSPGQAEEITRVTKAYPHLTDDQYVRENITRWLSES